MHIYIIPHYEVQKIGIEVAIGMSDPCTVSGGAVDNAVEPEVLHPPPKSCLPAAASEHCRFHTR